LLIEDPAFEKYLHWTPSEVWEYAFSALAAAFVIGVGYLRHSMQHAQGSRKPKRVAKKAPAARRQKTQMKASRR
jgi:hypothetical protein